MPFALISLPGHCCGALLTAPPRLQTFAFKMTGRNLHCFHMVNSDIAGTQVRCEKNVLTTHTEVKNFMSELIISMAGTPEGGVLAIALALLSAMAHAIFGAVNKGGMDPYLNRGAINACYSIMAAPVALFIVPFPSGDVWIVLLIAFFVHLVYEWLQSTSFHLGAFTLVYPIARGTGPLITALLAIFVFHEHLQFSQWLGLLVLSGAILSLALVNLRSSPGLARKDLSAVKKAAFIAFVCGIFISIYTTIDAYGIRLAADPFSFLFWFFFLGGFGFPVISVLRWRKLDADHRPQLSELAIRGFFGAIIAFISFGSLMLATRIGNVAQAAALRETSIIFATGIGVLIFHEKIDAKRLFIIGLIAVGAIMVEYH